MRTSTVSLKRLTLVLFALAAADVTVACVADTDPPNLNPQPLPPEPPPEEGTRKSTEAQDPGAFNSADEAPTAGGSAGATGPGPIPRPDGGR